MEEMSLAEIVIATEGKLATEVTDYTIDGVSTDSRTIGGNQLFVPLKGEFFDGHNYIKSAYEKGCRLSLSMMDIDAKDCPGLMIIKVDDTLKALQRLAKYYYKKFNTFVVAVTGSTGKTSTKEMVWSVLSQKYNVHKNKGNLNNEIGLPLSIFSLNKNYDVAVLEMGMSDLGEIRALCDIVPPSIGVITNIGVSHIENLKTQDNIFKAKMEITANFSEENTLVVNSDDRYLSKIKNTDYDIVTCSMDGNSSIVRAKNIKSLGEEGVEYTLIIGHDERRVLVPQPGIHNVGNSLLAAGVGYKMGLSLDEIADGLSHNTSTYMRLDITKGINNCKIINDSYNASPDSMKSALSVLKEIGRDRRTIAVLGDMFELGDISEQSHREVGRYASSIDIDVIICIGNDTSFVYQEAIKAKGNNCYYFKTKEEAVELLKLIVQSKDTVLIKGSRGMEMEKIVDILKEGEE